MESAAMPGVTGIIGADIAGGPVGGKPPVGWARGIGESRGAEERAGEAAYGCIPPG